MRILIFLFLLLILPACAPLKPPPVTEVVRVYITATQKPTRTPTRTPSPSPTPTSSPTPTATVIPAAIIGYPRGHQLLDPTPVYGAPCGLVDTFDFPLDPPHGDTARGGFGFGAYNSNYNKYHAGEDWGFNRASNLGQSVYSIGHGQVTYAAPNGWGLDGGTVVIRHVFPWGGYVLSFYGHLSPTSVTLKTGDCVQRGDEVGKIGNPRTPPHLHFEVRLHLPNSTGHGYWSTNPAKAGWLPPSQTIWETRMAASPGVIWIRPYAEGFIRALGISGGNLILIQDNHIFALDPNTGTQHWAQPISDTVRNALLDSDAGQIYLLDIGGNLTAYAATGPSEIIWETNLNALTSAALIPFPGGGVLVADRYRVILINPKGQVLWEVDDFATPASWVHNGTRVIMSIADSTSPLWTLDVNGADTWENGVAGSLTQSEEQIYLYAKDGIYQLDIENQDTNLLYPLTNANPSRGGLTTLPGGDLFFLVEDGSDRLLLSIHPDGGLNWKRSLKNLPRGEAQWITQGIRSYLFLSHTSPAGIQTELYAIDPENKSLTHIMTGGSRMSYTRNTWLLPLNENHFVVNIGGGPLVALDPESALVRMTSP